MKITILHNVADLDKPKWTDEYHGRKQKERTKCGIIDSQITGRDTDRIEVTHEVQEEDLQNAKKAIDHITDFHSKGERKKAGAKSHNPK